MKITCPHCEKSFGVLGIPETDKKERDFFLDQLKATKQYVAEHINELQFYILNLDRMLKKYE